MLNGGFLFVDTNVEEQSSQGIMFLILLRDPRWGQLTTSAGPRLPERGGGGGNGGSPHQQQQQLPPIILAVARAAATCQGVHYSYLGVNGGG
jgi:hypothetical protein